MGFYVMQYSQSNFFPSCYCYMEKTGPNRLYRCLKTEVAQVLWRRHLSVADTVCALVFRGGDKKSSAVTNADSDFIAHSPNDLDELQ